MSAWKTACRPETSPSVGMDTLDDPMDTSITPPRRTGAEISVKVSADVSGTGAAVRSHRRRVGLLTP
jgi:hypothetical protein